VVLGGGGSGLVAAVRAAQVSGKRVKVLEKNAYIARDSVEIANLLLVSN